MTDAAADTPTALRLHAGRRILEVEWPGAAVLFPHRFLRERCPCALCRQQHRQGTRVVVDADIALLAIEAYGQNAVQLRFSDGHARGIYPFPYLRELKNELVDAPPALQE